MAILFRDYLQSRVSIVGRDAKTPHMWVRLQATYSTILYIAICYFPPDASLYARPTESQEVEETMEGGSSPYGDLSEEIMMYREMGEILLVGDFNAHTQS